MDYNKVVHKNDSQTRLNSVLQKWTNIVLSHNHLLLAIAFVITLLAISPANKLTVIWGEDSLFPLGQSTIAEREQRRDRIGGTGLVIGIVDGGTLKDRKRFADDLAQKLKNLDSKRNLSGNPSMLRYVLYKLPLQFFESRRLLYLSEQDLLHIEERLNSRLKQERLKNNPFYINLEPLEEPEIDISFRDLEERYGIQRFKEYPLSEDGSILAILFKPNHQKNNPNFPEEFTKWINLASTELLRTYDYPNVNLDLGGLYTELVASSKKQERVAISAIILTAIIFSILVLLLFKRFRPFLIILVCAIIGIVWLRAIAYFAFGTVNLLSALAVPMSLAFFMSYSLLFIYSYSQARKRNNNLDNAIAITVANQGRHMILSALVTIASFLLLTTFEMTNFTSFGILAAIGTLIMFTVIMTIMLPFMITWERVFTMAESSSVPIINPMPRKLPRSRGITAIGFSLALIGLFILLQSIFAEPDLNIKTYGNTNNCSKLVQFNYNFDYLKPSSDSAVNLRKKFQSVIHLRHNPIYIMAPNQLKLKQFIDSSNISKKSVNSAIDLQSSIHTFLPSDQKKKKEILKRIDQLATEENIGFLDSNIKRAIDDVRPILHPPEITLYQLPLGVIRAYSQHPSGTDILLELLEKSLSRLPDTINEVEWAQAVNQQINRLEDREVKAVLQNISKASLPIYENSTNERETIFKAMKYFNDNYLNTVGYIYPAENPLNGISALKLKKEIDKLLEKHPHVIAFGTAIDLAETIEGAQKQGATYMILICIVYLVTLLLLVRKPLRALTVCIPAAAMFLWPLPLMAMFGVQWNVFAFMVLPAVMGVAMDLGIRIYLQYWHDDQIGAVPSVLKTIPPILLRSAPLFIAAISWSFTSHQTLVYMASSIIMAIIITSVASLTFQPALLEQIHSKTRKW